MPHGSSCIVSRSRRGAPSAMLAKQYTITLPADYDMKSIRERVRGRAGGCDAFPGLAFKALLITERANGSAVNRYAPFYLWHETSATNEFLYGDGFAALQGSFGRPVIELDPPRAAGTGGADRCETAIRHPPRPQRPEQRRPTRSPQARTGLTRSARLRAARHARRAQRAGPLSLATRPLCPVADATRRPQHASIRDQLRSPPHIGAKARTRLTIQPLARTLAGPSALAPGPA